MADLEVGDVVNNEQLCRFFECAPYGGMRRSLKKNALVIVSDHTKATYEDRWEGPVMHYTGMGLRGDQKLDAKQNRTLNESDSNGVSVHLFEVFKATQYVYQGQVRLAASPYFEDQPDIDGNDRKVVVFPVIRVDGSSPSFSRSQLDELQTVRTRKAKRLPDEEIERRAKGARKKSGVRNVSAPQYVRDAYVTEYAKRRANGICQLCENPAPFNNKKGEPYLETHHIVWMSRDGLDAPENTVALCPNCHRRMHVVDSREDIEFLQRKASSL